MVSTKIWSSTTVFNIDDNQKYFLSIKSEYENDFWRSCDWSNDAENTALITEINYIVKSIQIEKVTLNKNMSQYFYNRNFYFLL